MSICLRRIAIPVARSSSRPLEGRDKGLMEGGVAGLEGNDIFGMVGGVICFVGVGVGVGEISCGSAGESGNVKLIVGRGFGSTGALGVVGLASGEGSVGVMVGGVIGGVSGVIGWGAVGSVFGRGVGSTTVGVGFFATTGASSEPKTICNEGVSGISIARISERLNPCEIFSKVVEVI